MCELQRSWESCGEEALTSGFSRNHALLAKTEIFMQRTVRQEAGGGKPSTLRIKMDKMWDTENVEKSDLPPKSTSA